jgi:predicted nucleic acid-binding protein
VTAFFDTNVLVYAFSSDAKRGRALDLVAGGGIISAQVLNEFTSVLRTKQRQQWPVIEAVIRTVHAHFPEIAPLTAGTHGAAVALARDHNLSFYDALIVAAAAEAGCNTLYSEDLQDGRGFSGLSIVNPFAAPRQ